MCDLETIGTPSIFNVIRKAAALANTRSDFVLADKRIKVSFIMNR